MIAEQRRRQRAELLALSERLVAEYASVIPAGRLMRTVARCHQAHLRRHGTGGDLVAAVERAARAELDVIVPAHRIA